MALLDMFYSMFKNKCTRCHQGDIFEDSNPYHLKNIFKMHHKCTHCDLKYEKEPAFFYGAMYVSYGITAGWFILWFILQTFFLQLDVFLFIGLFIPSIVLISPLSFRWSRIIWLYMFYAYDNKFEKKD